MIGVSCVLAWVPYVLFGLAVIVLPVILRFYAEDHPRNDEDDGEPALAT